MHVRNFTPEDFDKAYRLWKDVGLWVRPYDQELSKFGEMLRLKNDLCFVLDDDGEIVGTILGAYDGRSASIHRLAVKKSLQRKGYGRMLMQTLEDVLKEKGITKMMAQVHISNKNVVNFYKNLGYKEDPLITLTKDLQ